MHSCYASPTQINGDTIYINESERHHLLKVLRLRSGDVVQVLDGAGNSYIASLCDDRSLDLRARILHHDYHPEIPPRITLFQGLPKSKKMDLIAQKTTEIGVDEIVPMSCQRTIPTHTPGAEKKRTDRWQRIANEAAKQCKRPRFAKILPIEAIDRCLQQAIDLDLSIVLMPNAEGQGLKEILRCHLNAKSVGLFVGPEGGFSAHEVELALQNGCCPATTGANILRTETAAIVGVALAVYEMR